MEDTHEVSSQILTDEELQELNTESVYLTPQEIDELSTLLVSKGIQIEDSSVGALKRVAEPIEGKSLLVLEMEGRVKLSSQTRKMEIEALARAARKRRSLRYRKPYTRKRGTVHPKKKQATERRRRERQWREHPLLCVLHRNRYKCKRIDQDSWHRIVDPLWTRFDPKDLTVVFPRRAGTRADPWTVYNMNIIHKELGVVYNGQDQLLFDLSGGLPPRTGEVKNEAEK